MRAAWTPGLSLAQTVEDCRACAITCDETLATCRALGGRFVDQTLLAALQDAASLSRVCAELLERESPAAGALCVLCADACTDCADACMEVLDEPQLLRCLAITRVAAAAVREWAWTPEPVRLTSIPTSAG